MACPVARLAGDTILVFHIHYKYHGLLYDNTSYGNTAHIAYNMRLVGFSWWGGSFYVRKVGVGGSFVPCDGASLGKHHNTMYFF